MTKAMTPKITPSTPRSAISHQLRASASPRLSGTAAELRRNRSFSDVVLILHSQQCRRGKAASGAGVTLALTRATDGTKADSFRRRSEGPLVQDYAQNL